MPVPAHLPRVIDQPCLLNFRIFLRAMAEQAQKFFSNHPVVAVAGTGAVLIAAPALAAVHGTAGIQAAPKGPYHHLRQILKTL